MPVVDAAAWADWAADGDQMPAPVLPMLPVLEKLVDCYDRLVVTRAHLESTLLSLAAGDDMNQRAVEAYVDLRRCRLEELLLRSAPTLLVEAARAGKIEPGLAERYVEQTDLPSAAWSIEASCQLELSLIRVLVGELVRMGRAQESSLELARLRASSVTYEEIVSAFSAHVKLFQALDKKHHPPPSGILVNEYWSLDVWRQMLAQTLSVSPAADRGASGMVFRIILSADGKRAYPSADGRVVVKVLSMHGMRTFCLCIDKQMRMQTYNVDTVNALAAILDQVGRMQQEGWASLALHMFGHQRGFQGVTRVLGIGTIWPMIVMEEMDMSLTTLRKRLYIDMQSRLPLVDVLCIGLGVSCGLSELRTLNIVHLDLQSGNVLVKLLRDFDMLPRCPLQARSGVVKCAKVCDMGLVRYMQQQKTTSKRGASADLCAPDARKRPAVAEGQGLTTRAPAPAPAPPPLAVSLHGYSVYNNTPNDAITYRYMRIDGGRVDMHRAEQVDEANDIKKVLTIMAFLTVSLTSSPTSSVFINAVQIADRQTHIAQLMGAVNNDWSLSERKYFEEIFTRPYKSLSELRGVLEENIAVCTNFKTALGVPREPV